MGALVAAGWTESDFHLLEHLDSKGKLKMRNTLRADVVTAIRAGCFELWEFPDWTQGVTAEMFLEKVAKEGGLRRGVTAAQLRDIQRQNIDFFLRYFRGKEVLGLKDVRESGIPFITQSRAGVSLYSHPLAKKLSTNSCALLIGQ